MTTVFLFARARDVVGRATVDLDLLPGSTVGDLRQRLAAEHRALAPLLNRCAVAVAEEYAADDAVIPSGAPIAIIPPVSGG